MITLRYSVPPDETFKFPRFRRASCNLMLSSSQAAISSCVCFLAIPRARSHRVVQSFGLLWVHRSPMSTFLKALSSLFVHQLFQSILLRARLFAHHSRNHSACARRRCRCSFSFALSHRGVSWEWRRLSHLGSTTLPFALRYGDMRSHHSCSKSLHRLLLRKRVSFCSSCTIFQLGGHLAA